MVQEWVRGAGAALLGSTSRFGAALAPPAFQPTAERPAHGARRRFGATSVPTDGGTAGARRKSVVPVPNGDVARSICVWRRAPRSVGTLLAPGVDQHWPRWQAAPRSLAPGPPWVHSGNRVHGANLEVRREFRAS